MITYDQYKIDLAEHIKAILQQNYTQITSTDLIFERPKVKEHGDLSTNYCMKVAKSANCAPRDLANILVDKIDRQTFKINSIEVAGPGFINFKIDRSQFLAIIETILNDQDKFGKFPKNGESVNIEFVSANPTGDLHLGHARGAAIGDSLARIMEHAGYDVTREYYVNDGGNQVNVLRNSINARYLQTLDANHPMPEEAYFGEDVIEVMHEICHNHNVSDMSEHDRLELFQNEGIRLELDKIKRDLAMFRIQFDVYSSERDIRQSGRVEQALEKLSLNGYTYESEGATWLKTTEFGDDKDRVLIKADGQYTYITPDIAYHENKFERGFDTLIDIVGGDHHGYMIRMKSAIAALGYNPDHLEFEIIQIVRLMQDGLEVKMSKRTGQALKLRELTQELSVDVVRYFFVMRSVDSPLDFDYNLALSQSNDNPVFYIQYAYARIMSILRQNDLNENVDVTILKDEDDVTFDLLEMISQFPDVVSKAATKRLPHLVTNYAYSLAAQFHSYYSKVRISDENMELSAARKKLILACALTIKKALDLVGVEVHEKM